MISINVTGDGQVSHSPIHYPWSYSPDYILPVRPILSTYTANRITDEIKELKRRIEKLEEKLEKTRG